MLLRKLIFQNIIWRGLYFFSLFLLNIIISRYFKADGSGEIYYIINNLSFILLIVSLSLESGVAYFISKKEISEKKAAWFCILWSVGATLISLFFFNFIKTNSSNNILPGKEFIFGCSSYVLGVLLTTFFTPMFFAKNNFILPNLILFLLSLLITFTLIMFGRNAFVHQHFAAIYFFSFLLQGTAITFIYCFQNKIFNKVIFFSQYDLQKIFKYSLLALSSNIIFFLVYRVDYWFVKYYCSENDLGNYIQVSKLVQYFLVIPLITANIIFPYSTNLQNTNQAEEIKLLCRLLFAFFFMLCLLLMLSGYWLFPFIFGTSFYKMYIPYCIMVPGILSLSIVIPLAAYFGGRNKVNINIFTSLTGLIIIIAGDAILIPNGKIIAAAAVSSIGYIACLIFSLYSFLKAEQTKINEILILKKNDLSRFIKKNKSILSA